YTTTLPSMRSSSVISSTSSSSSVSLIDFCLDDLPVLALADSSSLSTDS
ncbi:hypothetical protein OGATHE_004910, partial [Ogataea polymorpha]